METRERFPCFKTKTHPYGRQLRFTVQQSCCFPKICLYLKEIVVYLLRIKATLPSIAAARLILSPVLSRFRKQSTMRS